MQKKERMANLEVLRCVATVSYTHLLLIRKPEKGDGAEGGSGEQRPDGARGPVAVSYTHLYSGL